MRQETEAFYRRACEGAAPRPVRVHEDPEGVTELIRAGRLTECRVENRNGDLVRAVVPGDRRWFCESCRTAPRPRWCGALRPFCPGCWKKLRLTGNKPKGAEA